MPAPAKHADIATGSRPDAHGGQLSPCSSGSSDAEADLVLGAIILTGGAGSRMNSDKAALLWNGRRAVDRAASLAQSVGAKLVVTAGVRDYGLPLVQDDIPLGGPVGGILNGALVLARAGCDRALVLAVDAPTIRDSDLHPLIARGGRGAAYEGLHLPAVVAIAALPSAAQPDWPMALLFDLAGVERLECPPGARARLRGANTPAERQLLLDELVAHEGAHPGGPP